MARRSPSQYKHSLWDRLINPDLALGPAAGATSTSEVERIKDSVRRDLEWLLNSRQPPVDIPKGMNWLAQSLMTYGLPDLSSLNPGVSLELEQFQRTLEAVIRRFEPRLTDVRVAFTPVEANQHRASLHYRIDALLRLDPVPEPIIFNTELDLRNRAFVVRREGR